jgi:hypothetical protein
VGARRGHDHEPDGQEEQGSRCHGHCWNRASVS